MSKVKVRAGPPGKFSFPACCFLSISCAGLLVQRGSNENLGVTLSHPNPFSLRRWLILLFCLSDPRSTNGFSLTPQNCYSGFVCLSSTAPGAELKQEGTEGGAELYLCLGTRNVAWKRVQGCHLETTEKSWTPGRSFTTVIMFPWFQAC